MARLLVFNKDNTHPDPEIERRGSWKRGYIVGAFPDTHVFGSSETLPTFVVIDCPELDVAVARSYLEGWDKTVDYNVLSANPAGGSYQVELFGNNTSASGEAGYTRAQVENFLLRWACTIDSDATNSITFTLTLSLAVQSAGFWDADITGFNFNIDGYDSGTGEATITVSNLTDKQLENGQRKITERGGVVTGTTLDSITFTINRSAILDKFREDVAEKARERYCRKKYYINTTAMDLAEAAPGGVSTVTQAQLVANINNKLDE